MASFQQYTVPPANKKKKSCTQQKIQGKVKVKTNLILLSKLEFPKDTEISS